MESDRCRRIHPAAIAHRAASLARRAYEDAPLPIGEGQTISQPYIVAEMTEAQLADVLSDAPLERFTEFTCATPDAVRAEVAATRARGYAFDAEEKTLGMRCIAAAVFDHTGEAVAGISVSGPVSRVADDQIARLSASVMDAARALSVALGASAR